MVSGEDFQSGPETGIMIQCRRYGPVTPGLIDTHDDPFTIRGDDGGIVRGWY